MERRSKYSEICWASRTLKKVWALDSGETKNHNITCAEYIAQNVSKHRPLSVFLSSHVKGGEKLSFFSAKNLFLELGKYSVREGVQFSAEATAVVAAFRSLHPVSQHRRWAWPPRWSSGSEFFKVSGEFRQKNTILLSLGGEHNGTSEALTSWATSDALQDVGDHWPLIFMVVPCLLLKVYLGNERSEDARQALRSTHRCTSLHFRWAKTLTFE